MMTIPVFTHRRLSRAAGAERPVSADTSPVPLVLQRLLTIAWALLLLLGGMYLVAPLMDLRADLAGSIPADHSGTFQRLTGLSWRMATTATPGLTHYLTRLEVGYAMHELVFGLLFLAIIAIPFRRRARWAWWTAWAALLANLAYSLTFGPYDSTVLARSMIADVALPVLLLAHLPAFFGRCRVAR